MPSAGRGVAWKSEATTPGERDISTFLRLTRTGAFYLVTFLLVTGGSIWLALQVAPLQTVSAAGQTAQVGAALPSLSLSGPGELDLFGQVMPTKPQFEGPIRPLLQLTHITIDAQVAQLLRSDSPRTLELNLSASSWPQGWKRYFEWETLIAAGFAVVGLIAVAGVRQAVAQAAMAKTVVIAGLVAVAAVNVGGVAADRRRAPRPCCAASRRSTTWSARIRSRAPPQHRSHRPLPGVQAVVIGDSTAGRRGQPDRPPGPPPWTGPAAAAASPTPPTWPR